MKPKLLISTTLLLLFIVGCVSSLRPTSSPSTALTPSPVLTPTATNVPVISSTPPPTATNLTANWETSRNCVNEYATQPEGIKLEGVVALRSLSGTVLALELSLLDLKDGASKNIDTSNQPADDVDVSPDRHTLAYTWFNNTTSQWELVLVGSAGSLRKVAWSSDEEFGFQGWLNDYQLVIVQDSEYIVIDSNQDSQLSFSPNDFPDFNLYSSDFFVTFDPFLSRAIYRDGQTNVLDLKTNAVIAQIKDGYDRTPIVDWRPSAEQAAVVASLPLEQNTNGLPDEIFIVENDGEVRQLTHLYDTFGRILTIDSLSWSPDGKKIAFWLYDGQGNDTLMVADYVTGDAINYCVLNVTQTHFPIGLSAPIWSPNGKYLLVESRYAIDKNKLLVVDISNKIAFPIAENANPVGWMEPE